MKTRKSSKDTCIHRNQGVPLQLWLLLVGGMLAVGSATAARRAAATPTLLPVSSAVNRAVGIAAAPQSDANDLTVRLDYERAASQLITTEGGIVEATSADGTIFRLTLPPGALLSEEEITLTPVTAVENAPLSGGLAGAVQIGPEDLMFWKPATLEVQPVLPPSPQEELPFGWSNQGEDPHLHSLLLPSQLPNSQTVGITPRTSLGMAFRVLNGGGLGIGRDIGADLLLWRQKQPCQIRHQLEHQLQELFGPERERQLMDLPANPDVMPKAISLVSRFYKSYLRSEIKRALKSKNEALQKCALQNALSVLRQLELLGATEENSTYTALRELTTSLMKKALQTGFDDAKKNCNILKMLAAEGQAQKMGFPSLTDDISSLPTECAIHLLFDSQVVIIGSDSDGETKVTVSVTSDMPLHYKDLVQHFRQSAPLRHQTVKYEQEGCTAQASYTDSVLQITLIQPDLNIRVDSSCKTGQQQCRVVPTKFAIAIMPHRLDETFVVQCDGESDNLGPLTWWLTGFGYLHESQVSLRGDFDIRGFVLDTSSETPTIARKEYRQSVVSTGPRGRAEISEVTNIELRGN